MELSADERLLVDLYASQYNQAISQSNRLYDQIASLYDQINRITPTTNELRHNIQQIYVGARNIASRNQQQGQTQTQGQQQGQTQGQTQIQGQTQGQQPVEIPATVHSIETQTFMSSVTTTRVFSEIVRPLNTECPIRLDPFLPTSVVAQINRCGHIFNPIELGFWLQTNTRCPTCRTDVRRFQPQGQQQQQRQPRAQRVADTSDQIITNLFYDLIFNNTDTNNNINNNINNNPPIFDISNNHITT